jgi:hypothetical protein
MTYHLLLPQFSAWFSVSSWHLWIHNEHIVKRASCMLGFIYRITKPFRSVSSYLTLFYTPVRSLLEYNKVIWSPFYISHEERIELIQKKFVRMLSFRMNLHRTLQCYEDRLERFQMMSLKCRRKLIEQMILYNIIHSQIDSPYLILLSQLTFKTHCRVRKPRLFTLCVYVNNTSY